VELSGADIGNLSLANVQLDVSLAT
jgi:hypothetical protein